MQGVKAIANHRKLSFAGEDLDTLIRSFLITNPPMRCPRIKGDAFLGNTFLASEQYRGEKARAQRVSRNPVPEERDQDDALSMFRDRPHINSAEFVIDTLVLVELRIVLTPMPNYHYPMGRRIRGMWAGLILGPIIEERMSKLPMPFIQKGARWW